jgi:hypothetical protein
MCKLCESVFTHPDYQQMHEKYTGQKPSVGKPSLIPHEPQLQCISVWIFRRWDLHLFCWAALQLGFSQSQPGKYLGLQA